MNLILLTTNDIQENNSCKYQIQYPNIESFQNTELYVNEFEIKLTSKDQSINEFKLTSSNKIISDRTIAKFNRKTNILTLTVFY